MSIDYARTAVMAPPPGFTTNSVQSKSQANLFTAVTAVCFSLMLLIVILRLYSRICITRSFAKDDAACILATIGIVAYTIELCIISSLIERDKWDVPDAENFLRTVVVLTVVSGPTIFFAKLSLFWLYLRLFSPNCRTRYLVYFGIMSTFAVYTFTPVYIGYMYIPRPGQSWLERASSYGGSARLIYFGIFGVVSDFYLFILPIQVIWQLQLPLRKRIAILVIFATGFLACIASILGLYYRVESYKHYEITWGLLLSAVELYMGIICGCMPHLAPFFRHHRVKSVFSTLKQLSSPITSKFSKRSLLSEERNGAELNNFDRVNSNPSNGHSIETPVLGSVKREEKFLCSGDHAQREWVWRASNSAETEGLPTHREAWD